MRLAFKHVLGAVAVGLLIVGATAGPAEATEARYPTRIVFSSVPGQTFTRHWSLDTTSVPAVAARARLICYKPSLRRWAALPGRSVQLYRGDAAAGQRIYGWRGTTDGSGYFTVKMSYPDKYTARYAGSSSTLPCSAARYRVDTVEMARSTMLTTSTVDPLNLRFTLTTDYKYNPTVAAMNGRVAYRSALGAADAQSGSIQWIHVGSEESTARPLTGSGRSKVSVVIPDALFDTARPVYRPTVEYPGRFYFRSKTPGGEELWHGPPTTGPGALVPDTLWKPPAQSVPATGNYVYLECDADDYVGGGGTYLYTPYNSYFGVSMDGGRIDVNVNGDEWWYGEFQSPDPIESLQSGYYPAATRYPCANPLLGGMEWGGESRGSNTLTGWYVIDGATQSNGVLQSIDIRFEQHSEGGSPALRGAIHWTAGDSSRPPGPVNPIPDALWTPPAVSVPATCDYVYLQSDPGDFVGDGRTYLFSSADASIGVIADGNRLSVSVNQTEWQGEFRAMDSIVSLLPGYYPGLQRYGFHNPAKGGLDWMGEWRGGNEIAGWVAIDRVTYEEGVLKAIDVRFEQHADGATAALRGVVHWAAD